MTEAASEASRWRGFRVLVVSPTPTHPQDHGNRKRIYEVCRALQRQGAEIHFVHYPGEHDWRHQRVARFEQQMRDTWEGYQLVAPSRALHTDSRGVDHDIDEWADVGVADYVRWACRVERYEMIIVNYVWMSFALEAAPREVLKVCDTHDVFGGRRAMLESQGIKAEFFHTTPEGEAFGLARADVIWAIKNSERDYFAKRLGFEHSLTLPHDETEREYWTAPPSTDGWLRAGVIGARNNINRRNLEDFLNDALPVTARYMAPIKFILAGGLCDDFAGYQHPNVEILGRVDEVAEFYRKVDVVLAPMHFGTGLKIKVAEALAAGAPVIAHEHAMDGYPTDEPLHHAPSFAAMAVELVKLAFDRSRLEGLAERSRAVRAAVRSEVAETLRETHRRLVDRLGERLAIVAPLAALNPNCLLYDHLYSVIEYVRHIVDVDIFLMGAPVMPPLDLLNDFGLINRVFADPTLIAGLGEKAPASWTPIQLDDWLTRRGYRRAYLLADCREALAQKYAALREAYVRKDAIDLGGGDSNELIDHLRQNVDTVVIGAVRRDIQSWHGRPGIVEIVHAPFRRAGHFVRFSLSTGRGGCSVLILAHKEDLVAEQLAILVEKLGGKASIVDLENADDAYRIFRSDTRRAQPIDAISDLEAVVSLGSPNYLSDILAEAALRTSVPFLTLLRGAEAIAARGRAMRLRPTSLYDLFRSVALCLCDTEARAASRRDAASQARVYAGDAGWTMIWRRLSVRPAS